MKPCDEIRGHFITKGDHWQRTIRAIDAAASELNRDAPTAVAASDPSQQLQTLPLELRKTVIKASESIRTRRSAAYSTAVRLTTRDGLTITFEPVPARHVRVVLKSRAEEPRLLRVRGTQIAGRQPAGALAPK